MHGACSGVYVTTPRSWWSHGGQDERFRGWGFEDAAWYVAHETLLDEVPRRHEGIVYALNHTAQAREGDQYDANAALMEQYREARSSRDAMRQLVGTDATAENGLATGEKSAAALIRRPCKRETRCKVGLGG